MRRLQLMNPLEQLESQGQTNGRPVRAAPLRVARRDLARLLKPAEVAEARAISTRLLCSLTNCGDIPSLKIGKTVRYEPKDIELWIQQQKKRKRPWND